MGFNQLQTAMGRVADAAVQTVDTASGLLAYMKGVVNGLYGAAGIETWPAAAVPGNGVSLAEVIRKIYDLVALVGTQAAIDIIDGYFDVPTADATTDATIRDVVGRKTDAVVTAIGTTKSLMAYAKSAISLHTVPTADAVTDAFMRDVVGRKTDAAVNTVGVVSTIMAYLKALVAGSNQGAGTYFSVYKQITKTALDLATPVDITDAAATGAIEIVDAIVQNDANNMGGATLVELYTDNVEGLGAFLSSAIANWDSGGVVLGAKRVVLETGKKVIVRCTGADLTGTGTFGVWLVCKRLTAGATFAAD